METINYFMNWYYTNTCHLSCSTVNRLQGTWRAHAPSWHTVVYNRHTADPLMFYRKKLYSTKPTFWAIGPWEDSRTDTLIGVPQSNTASSIIAWVTRRACLLSAAASRRQGRIQGEGSGESVWEWSSYTVYDEITEREK